MTLRSLSALLLVTGLSLVSRQAAAKPLAPTPMTEEQKTLYALGQLVGRSLRDFSLTPAELLLVKRGITDSVNGKKSADSEAMMPKVQELARARAAVRAEQEKKKSQLYADKAAAEPGATRLPSGLVYKSITEGTGPSPAATDVVKAHYLGTLTDGTVFDSSVQRGEPLEFPLSGVIPCWTEGVQKMKVGGKARLVCPSFIAYGDMGRPPTIPGGATLVFEVELLEVKPQSAPPVPIPSPSPSPSANPPGDK